jgi:phosphoribulokinase
MSAKFPVLAITGSSGAGTTTVKSVFQEIFRREGLVPAVVEGDAVGTEVAEDAAALFGFLGHLRRTRETLPRLR